MQSLLLKIDFFPISNSIMRRTTIFLLLITSAFIHVNWVTGLQPPVSDEIIRNTLQSELKNILQELAVSSELTNRELLKIHYTRARKYYKHIEFFIEYCSSREAKNFINGPLVPKTDLELSNEVIPAQGFQRIEELLFNKDTLPLTTLREQYQLLSVNLAAISNYYLSIEINQGQLLEMYQVELFRIAAMNLNGYDATISQTNVMESYWCLEGMEQFLKSAEPLANENNELRETFVSVCNELTRAKQYLQAHPDFATFNRLKFITDFITPLNRDLITFHHLTHLPWTERVQALDLKKRFLFGRESLNTQYFSMYYDDTLHIDVQAQLGRLLFFDPILSGNNKNSCATCHDPSKAFTDGLPKGSNFDHTTSLARNTPTLLNVIFQKAFFYDGRAYQLEQQIFDVLHNKTEMQSNFTDVIEKLQENSTYKKLFLAAFKGTPDSVITSYAIQKSIMEYEKTLISMNSRFDKYLHGDKSKLNAREINGYNLFAGKALCGSCHFFPLFNGTVPPFYNDNEYEVIGVPATTGNNELDTDNGRYTITSLKEQRNAFKTPTVRNIALTPPYMHNGVYKKLEDVIEFYHKGGGLGFKLRVPNQTLPFDSLQLAPTEKVDIVLFLKTLTDTIGLANKPNSLPPFDGKPQWNNRLQEGSY